MSSTTVETVISVIQGKTKLEEIAKALPSHMPADRFVRMAITMMRRPDLQECTPESLIASIFEAAQMGLYLDNELGHAYLVGFKHRDPDTGERTKEAQMMMGFRGYIYLGKASAGVNDVDPSLVYAGDDFDYQLGDNPYCHHKPTRKADERGEITAAYNVIRYTNGLRAFRVMEMEELGRIWKIATARGGGKLWRHADTRPQMFLKTAVIHHLKWAGLSADLTRYATRDEYYTAGVIGHDPKEIEAKVTKTAELLGKINGGTRVEEPVESESPPDAEKAGLTEADRPKLQADHEMLSTKLGKRRLSSSRIKEMPISLLADAVEVLRQDVAKLTTSSKNPPQSGVDGEDSPYRS